MKFLSYADLKPQKGIPGTKITLWRKEREYRFPRRTPMGRFYGWPEHVIDAYVHALVAGHNECEATALAERARDSADAESLRQREAESKGAA